MSYDALIANERYVSVFICTTTAKDQRSYRDLATEKGKLSASSFSHFTPEERASVYI
jgi:hypothetical protein